MMMRVMTMIIGMMMIIIFRMMIAMLVVVITLTFVHDEVLIVNAYFYFSCRTCLPGGQEYFLEQCEPEVLAERKKELKAKKTGKALV